MKIEIEVPELPEGADGACLGKDLPEGAVVTHFLNKASFWREEPFSNRQSWEGAIQAYTLPPYTQEIELPRPEPGYEWAISGENSEVIELVQMQKEKP